ncbi:hypothetical protein E1B28_000192 [Marasmius oreades]|uniref:Mucoidy inhibitor A n=1 Tax=Marasmius oreades TaxID=181124 RepID=A0A9P7V101_9AGAR|nr:uncharacterized protein E1B28_000192 [Marasmius oreades]KAG7098225.1 hypothetical protein E1B28_000192 [Marasmius oreades]
MVNDIKLNHARRSEITGVNLYGSRAEITRSFKLGVKEGQNNVEIEGLPWVLINDSLRVEGRGPATIHDVNLSPVEGPLKPPTTATLDELSLRKKRTENAFERCKKSIGALEGFLNTVNAQFTKSNDLRNVLENYDASAGVLDDKVMELEKELSQIEEQIKEERKRIAPKTHHDLGYRMSVGVVADSDTEVELVLIYAVTSASWKAAYDIRVDTSGGSNPVKLIYKAVITNATREPWDNVPLTLETATPTFGVELPSLDQWTLSVYQPTHTLMKSKRIAVPHASRATLAGGYSGETEKYHSTIEDSSSPMAHLTTQVTSKGAISATYRVPGLVTIPSDSSEHTFTIVELDLDAAMTWYSAPKLDTRVHLKAKVRNDSEYALLSGNASVYVDGSFISKTTVPAVSPLESFDCPLGLDQAVRITYHPVSKKASTSGFYNKSASHLYIQRLTIHNTKASGIPLLKVVDHIPVSEDSSITVKLISPALKVPSIGGGGLTTNFSETHGTLSLNKSDNKPSVQQSQSSSHTRTASVSVAEVVASSAGPNVKVANGIVAQWDSADEESVDGDALGRDGKINWLCEIPAGEKVNLSLQWEVSMPAKTRVVGL